LHKYRSLLALYSVQAALDCAPMRRGGRLLLVVAAVAVACLVALPSSAGAATHWLCKPGKKDNPCDVSLATTSFSPNGKRLGVDRIKAPKHPKFDCFYVYPTVSDQQGATADFSIDPELRSIVLYQAARYTSDCRMFAPVYRQVTLQGILGIAPPTAEERERAYTDVRDAWLDYLKHYNGGRGVVFIGHSQGTFVLRELLAKEVDNKPRVRKLLISGLLLGGNVTVKKGKDVGGDFKKIPACRARSQTGCVVAFSTFNAVPPEGSFFGRTSEPGLEVLCTNPAALGGGSASITPIQPSAPFAPSTTIGAAVSVLGVPEPPVSTAWRAFPGSYRARCSSAGGADVLSISSVGQAPVFAPSPTPEWGLHLVDANIALGQQVGLVRKQAAVWRRGQR
jgi:pimeloyl-ACP methyl ester carboxylesterase